MERRLTAILAADVVGYSRLMGANEAGTLAALKSLRTEFISVNRFPFVAILSSSFFSASSASPR